MNVRENICRFGTELCLTPRKEGSEDNNISQFIPPSSFINSADQIFKMDNKKPSQLLKKSAGNGKKPLNVQKIDYPFWNRRIEAVQTLQSKGFPNPSVKNVALEELNHKLPLFKEFLQHDDDSATSLLLHLTYQYYASLNHMYVHENIPTLQIQKVLKATIFESEIGEDLLVFLEPKQVPDSCLTLFLISQFFHSLALKSGLSAHKCLFLNLITDCCKTLMMIKLILKYIPNGLRDKARLVVQDLLEQRLLSLKDHGKILIPGGWINLPVENIEGHFVLYLLERRDSSTFVKIRINTHEPIGLSDQTSVPSMIEEEIISTEQLKMFVSDILDLLFPDTLAQISQRQDNRGFLLETGRQYSEEVSSLSSRLDIEMQRYSFNCSFMACFILYQYLYSNMSNINLKEKNLFLLERAPTEALEFRRDFQRFLSAVCKQNSYSSFV